MQQLELFPKSKEKRVIVKVKNKPNHIKAVKYLGKYAQHKPLLNEVQNIEPLELLSLKNI